MCLIFQLGTFAELSLAEIVARWPKCAGGELIPPFFICDLAENPDFLLKNLGGTVKIIGELPTKTAGAEEIAEEILRLTQNRTKERINFGLSFTGELDHKLGIAVKRLLQAKSGVAVRFLQSKTPLLSSVQVKTNGLLPPDGAEITVISTKSKTILGQTLVVQDFADYSFRDFDRPGRDARRGMLPPKVAKIMLNLALGEQNPATATAYDPFCGSGTVLAEAVLLGFSNIIGSDLSKKAVEDSRRALGWLTKNYDLTPNLTIFQHDAREAATNIKSKSIDCLVAEPFLGKPLHEGEHRPNKEWDELTELYEKSFNTLHSLLKPGARVVLVLPFDPQTKATIDKKRLFSSQKYTLSPILPTSPTIFYSRPEQMIGREIVRLIAQ